MDVTFYTVGLTELPVPEDGIVHRQFMGVETQFIVEHTYIVDGLVVSDGMFAYKWIMDDPHFDSKLRWKRAHKIGRSLLVSCVIAAAIYFVFWR